MGILNLFLVLPGAVVIFKYNSDTPFPVIPFFLSELCLDAGVPGMIGVSMGMIVIHFRLKECIIIKIIECLIAERNKQNFRDSIFGFGSVGLYH